MLRHVCFVMLGHVCFVMLGHVCHDKSANTMGICGQAKAWMHICAWAQNVNRQMSGHADAIASRGKSTAWHGVCDSMLVSHLEVIWQLCRVGAQEVFNGRPAEWWSTQTQNALEHAAIQWSIPCEKCQVQQRCLCLIFFCFVPYWAQHSRECPGEPQRLGLF
jgi:hypothetical protein